MKAATRQAARRQRLLDLAGASRVHGPTADAVQHFGRAVEALVRRVVARQLRGLAADAQAQRNDTAATALRIAAWRVSRPDDLDRAL